MQRVHRLHTLPFVLTFATACGSGATQPKAAPTEPAEVRVVVMQPIMPDAAPPDAPEPPKLACDAGTTAMQPPAPEPTWFCGRPDGTRHGPFITLFPDSTVEIAGTYSNGKLAGAWERHYPGGALAEEGNFTNGLPDGHWRQLGPSGALLGEYDMKAGTGTIKKWFDDGPIFMEKGVRNGVPNGTLKLYDHEGYIVVTAKYFMGRMHGDHDVGTRQTLRIEESFKNGVRTGPRQIWQFTMLAMEEAYDKGKLDGAFTIWRDRKIPRVQGNYDHGKRIGTWTWFDRANNKEREGDYADGKKTGYWFEWYENKLVFSGSYTDGLPDGEFVYYDRIGNELGRFEIKDGTGWMQTFYPNKNVATKTYMFKGVMGGLYQELTMRTKKPVVEGHYADDRKHGVWREWTETATGMQLTLEQHWKYGKLDGAVKKYVDGKVVEESTYKMGKAEGAYVEYRNGKPALTGQFTADKKTGTWTSYDDSGAVVLDATYKDGVLDGPWKQLVAGVVVEGTMAAGRRTGTWTRTDRTGATEKTTYGVPQ